MVWTLGLQGDLADSLRLEMFVMMVIRYYLRVFMFDFKFQRDSRSSIFTIWNAILLLL